MSAVTVTIQALLDAPAVTALAGTQIKPGIAPQNGTLPDVVVHLISDESYEGLALTTDLRQARVSVECRARTFTESDALAEATIKALRNLRAVRGKYAVFRKAVTDVTDHADDRSVFRRIHDQYLVYRD